MPRFSFDSSQQVSSGLSLLLVFVLSMAVGWLAVNTSENIVRGIENSPIVQIEERESPVTEVNGNN